jgi:hypothetical protein
MSKLTLILAGAAGYVLGARAGRERYEQIADGTRALMRNPKVQSARKQATDAVVDTAKGTASAAADKVRRSNDGGAHTAPSTWPTDSAAPHAP